MGFFRRQKGHTSPSGASKGFPPEGGHIVFRFGKREFPILRFADLSIKRKLMLIVMASSTIALVVLCVAMVIFDVMEIGQSVKNELSNAAAMTAYHCAEALAPQGPPGEEPAPPDRGKAAEALGMLEVDQRIVTAFLFDRSGNEIARYFRDRVVEKAPDDIWTRPYIQPEGNHIFVVHPIIAEGQRMKNRDASLFPVVLSMPPRRPEIGKRPIFHDRRRDYPWFVDHYCIPAVCEFAAFHLESRVPLGRHGQTYLLAKGLHRPRH
jgi:hypothetical protein